MSEKYRKAVQIVAKRRNGLKLQDPEFFNQVREEYRKIGGSRRTSRKRNKRVARDMRKRQAKPVKKYKKSTRKSRSRKSKGRK